jgi:hypothetical protein
MDRGCRNFKKDDIVKGLKLVSEPYKISESREYRALVKCTLCDSAPFEAVLSALKHRIFDGCGCQKNRSNSPHWKSFKTWCLENNCEFLINLWDYNLNSKDPDEVSCRTADSYYFKCSKDQHPSTLHQIMSIATPAKVKRDTCKYCTSFAQHIIDQFGDNALDEYWDYNKNTIDPWSISYKCNETIWIKCIDTNYHDSFDITPKRFFMANGKCPYCNHKRIHPRDSFAYHYTQKYGEDFLDLYWDYDLNTLNPWEVSVQTNKDYIYLKCEAHGSYKITASNFAKFGFACPSCARERDKSKLQEKVEKYIDSVYHFDMMHEYKCSIIARNPKTNRWLPYDNDVLVNNHHLIIEVMGDQHYNVKSGWIERQADRYHTTPDKVLEDLQWRDEYKKQYALSQDYHYLAIPYWTENDESYKTIIDQKIQEILTIQN